MFFFNDFLFFCILWKNMFFMRNIYDCIYDFEKMVFVFYETLFFLMIFLWFFMIFFMFFLMIFFFYFFFVFYEKTCFLWKIYMIVFMILKKWFLCFMKYDNFYVFLFNLFCFFMIVMIFMSFSFLWCCVWFFIFCFSFLNNWLENIERTITLHVFYFKHMENSKQTTTFFISHTWRTLNKHWLCIYLFI